MNNDVLSSLERERSALIPPVLIGSAICVVAFIMFIGGIGMQNFGTILFGLLLAVIGILYFMLAYSPKHKAYEKHYKDSIVTATFEEAFGKISYLADEGFSKDMIRETGFMQLGNRYHSEDLITGAYNGIRFQRSDVLIQDHRSNGKSSYTVTYFQGRWITMSSNKHFNFDLQLIQAGFGYTQKKSSIFTRATDRRHKVEFENEEFNNRFTCYCQNDQEAFYLITPHIMEALMNYTALVNGKVMIGFHNNLIHLAVETGTDTLEPSLWSPLTYEKDILPVKNEVTAITSFINQLHMERNIFGGTN
ncbi:MAG: DUF3137 domain-containing protein [Lachnospiraceae bacterium]|nr:DUF3137 domain-containing protein [Lachnospiraceae bacterium]